MHMILGLIGLVVSASAFALPVYNCELTATPKLGAWREPWTKKLLLSPAFTNRVDFGQTVVELRVNAGAALGGAVNGQPNFLIGGDVWNGSFESAFHAGVVTCKEEIELPFVLKFKPWGQFYTLNPIVSEGHIQRDVSLGYIDNELICFIGDEKAALRSLSDALGVEGKLVNPYRIEFTWEAEDCIRGTGSYDEWSCEEYRRNRRTKTVLDCNGEPDPRS